MCFEDFLDVAFLSRLDCSESDSDIAVDSPGDLDLLVLRLDPDGLLLLLRPASEFRERLNPVSLLPDEDNGARKLPSSMLLLRSAAVGMILSGTLISGDQRILSYII